MEISYNDDDILKAAAKRMCPEGWHRFVITDAKQKVSDEKGSLMNALTCAPLKDPDDTNSKTTPTVSHWAVWPFPNPNIEGHTGPNTAGMVLNFLRALYGEDEFPHLPKRGKGKDASLMYKGEAIEDADEEGIRLEIFKSVFRKGVSLYNDPTQLVDESFYGLVEHQGDFAKFKDLRMELPDNAELVNWDEVEAVKKPSKVTHAPAKANGKANGKPVGKKK